MTDVLLVSLGSWGDVIPVLVIGAEMQRRGMRATILAAETYRQAVTDSGLAFVALGDPDLAASHEDILALQASDMLNFARKYFVKWNVSVFDTIRALDPDLVVAAHNSALLADLIAFAHGRHPLVRLMMQPPPPPSAGPSRHVIATAIDRSRDQRFSTERVNGTQQLTPEQEMEDIIRECMATVGCPQPDASTWEWTKAVQARVTSLGLWPTWYAPGTERGAVTPVGFLRQIGRTLPTTPRRRPGRPRMLTFVPGTLGTVKIWASQLYQIAAEVCAELDCQGLVLGLKHVPEGCVAHQRLECAQFVPLEIVARSSDLVVHHAGLGTIATCLACAVPQLVIPRMFGQLGNAAWLRTLGVATVLSLEDVNAATVAASIRELCQSQDVRTRCECVASWIDDRQTIRTLGDLLVHERVRQGRPVA